MTNITVRNEGSAFLVSKLKMAHGKKHSKILCTGEYISHVNFTSRRVSKFHNHGKTPSYQTFAGALMRKVVPKSLRKSLEGIEGPSSF